jgi:hypothetical protein
MLQQVRIINTILRFGQTLVAVIKGKGNSTPEVEGCLKKWVSNRSQRAFHFIYKAMIMV